MQKRRKGGNEYLKVRRQEKRTRGTSLDGFRTHKGEFFDRGVTGEGGAWWVKNGEKKTHYFS